MLGGVTLFLTGTTHNAVLLTIFYCACMFGLNCMIAPMVAILSDRVPSKIRGTMSAFYGAGSTIGAPIGTMLGALFIENLIPGFAVAGVLMFLGGVVAVIIIPKEQSADFLPKDEGSAKDILSFRPPKFSTAHDFYKAFAGRFCMLMAYQMINVYQLYIIQNYIGQSVKESAVTVSVVSMIMMVMSLVGSFISGPAPISSAAARSRSSSLPCSSPSASPCRGSSSPPWACTCSPASQASATPSTPPSTRRCWWTCYRTRKRPARIWAS